MLDICEVVKPGEKVLVFAYNEGKPMWIDYSHECD